MRHYSIRRRFIGAAVTMIGMAMLLGAVYSSIQFNSPKADVALAVFGVAMVCLGGAVNHYVVRRRISKRGYFNW